MMILATPSTRTAKTGREPSDNRPNLDERVKQVTRASVDHAVSEVVRRMSSSLKL